MLRSFVIVALAAGAVGVAHVAEAADVPGDRSTRAILPLSSSATSSQFESATDKDWYRLSLTKGQDYRVAWYAAETDAKATLRDKTGAALAAGYSQAGWLRWDWKGFEFRAGYTGLHYLALAAIPNSDTPPSSSSNYGVEVTKDCPSATLTRCQLFLNKTIKSRLQFGADTDALSMNLSANKSYILTISSSDTVSIRASILTATGYPAPSSWTPSSDGIVVTFKTTTAGRHYVEATGAVQTYSMLLQLQ